jgi:hypothetical protein
MGKKSSSFKLSSGNEVSRPTGGGVVTHGVQGKGYFASFAMNVMIEGEPAVRHLDLVTHNHMAPQPPNTPPAPWLSTMSVPAPPADSVVKDEKKETAWIRIAFVDDKGKPLTHIRCTIKLPDGQSIEAMLAGGAITVQGIPKGNCKVVCTDFGDATRTRARRRGGEQEKTGSSEAPPPAKEVKSSRKDLKGSGVTLATGDPYRVVVPPEPQTVTLHLVSADDVSVPEAKYIIAFADGSEKKGTLDRKGSAEVKDCPPGFYTVEYPDQDDVRAKIFAARAHAAVATSDVELLLGALAQPPSAVNATASAYKQYFSGGTSLEDDALALAKEDSVKLAVEHLLALAGLGPAKGEERVAFAEAEIDTEDAPKEPPGTALA